MPKWDIDPAGVKAVLTRTGTHVTSLSEALGNFATHLDSAVQHAGSPVIASAVGDFVQARTPELTAVNSRINAALTGTVKATVAYELGDQQMAANAQHAATHPPVPVAPPRPGGRARPEAR